VRALTPPARALTPLARARPPLARGGSPLAGGRCALARGRPPLARALPPLARARAPLARALSALRRAQGKLSAGPETVGQEAAQVTLGRGARGFHQHRQVQGRARQVGDEMTTGNDIRVEIQQASHELPLLFQAIAVDVRRLSQPEEAAPPRRRPDRLEEERRLPVMEDRLRQVPPLGALPGVEERQHPVLLHQRERARGLRLMSRGRLLLLPHRRQVLLAEGIQPLRSLAAHVLSPRHRFPGGATDAAGPAPEIADFRDPVSPSCSPMVPICQHWRG